MTLLETFAAAISDVEDPVRKRAVFIGMLSEEIERRTGRRPIVVGGSAVELYTQGAYRSADIDLKSPGRALLTLLDELAFEPLGRVYYQPMMDVCVDFVGEGLDEGAEAERRTLEIEIPVDGHSLRVRVISLEDLIVDRLAAARFWNDAESRIWAAVLIHIAGLPHMAFDEVYLQSRLQRESLTDIYGEVRTQFSGSAIQERLRDQEEH